MNRHSFFWKKGLMLRYSQVVLHQIPKSKQKKSHLSSAILYLETLMSWLQTCHIINFCLCQHLGFCGFYRWGDDKFCKGFFFNTQQNSLAIICFLASFSVFQVHESKSKNQRHASASNLVSPCLLSHQELFPFDLCSDFSSMLPSLKFSPRETLVASLRL